MLIVTFSFHESLNRPLIAAEGYCTNLCCLDPPSIFSHLLSINLNAQLLDGHPLFLRLILYLSMQLRILHAELRFVLRIPINLWSLGQAT